MACLVKMNYHYTGVVAIGNSKKFIRTNTQHMPNIGSPSQTKNKKGNIDDKPYSVSASPVRPKY